MLSLDAVVLESARHATDLLLFALLLWLSQYELHTGKIPNRYTYPSLILFLSLRLAIGPFHWLNYAATALGWIAFIYMTAYLFATYAQRSVIGGGAMKLLTVVAVAVGYPIFPLVMFLVLVIGVALAFLWKRANMHTSPLVAAAYLLVLAEQFVSMLPSPHGEVRAYVLAVTILALLAYKLRTYVGVCSKLVTLNRRADLPEVARTPVSRATLRIASFSLIAVFAFSGALLLSRYWAHWNPIWTVFGLYLVLELYALRARKLKLMAMQP